MKHQPHVYVAALVASACAGRVAPPATPAPARAAAAVAAAPAEPTTLRYTAGSGRYRLESRSHVEQEMMGQTNATDITTAALLTAAISEVEGNLGVTLTIDSLSVTTAIGGPDPTELAAAQGKTVRLVFSPSGRPISLVTADSASVTVQQIAQGLRDFLPSLPAATIAAGTSWSDTTSVTIPSMGLQVTVRRTSQHRVAGWEDRAGARALHIATTATYTVTGSGEAQGQQIELAGSGQSSADHYVSTAGVYLGSTASDSALVNANVVSAGMVVPVRRTTRITFTRLP